MKYRLLSGGCWLLAVSSTVLWPVGCSSKEDGGGDCTVGKEGCACYPNETCEVGLSCLSKLCVVDANSGTGGSHAGGTGSGKGASAGTSDDTPTAGEETGVGGSDSTPESTGGRHTSGGRAATAGGAQTGGAAEGGVTESGGSPAGGGSQSGGKSGGSTSGGAATGGVGEGGTNRGGATTGGNSTGGTTSTGGASTGGSANEVSDPRIIDNFSSCNNTISRVAGRDGSWFTYGDNDVNITPNTDSATPAPAASAPPSSFADSSCAAWVTGGCPTSADACAYAGNGFTFRADGGGYDVSAYTGIQFDYEGGDLWIVLIMAQGRTFGTNILASNGSRRTRSFEFSDLVASGETPTGTSMDLTQVTQVDFTTKTPSGFGIAIWDVRFF